MKTALLIIILFLIFWISYITYQLMMAVADFIHFDKGQMATLFWLSVIVTVVNVIVKVADE